MNYDKYARVRMLNGFNSTYVECHRSHSLTHSQNLCGGAGIGWDAGGELIVLHFSFRLFGRIAFVLFVALAVCICGRSLSPSAIIVKGPRTHTHTPTKKDPGTHSAHESARRTLQVLQSCRRRRSSAAPKNKRLFLRSSSDERKAGENSARTFLHGLLRRRRERGRRQRRGVSPLK